MSPDPNTLSMLRSMQASERSRRANLGMADVLYEQLMQQVAKFEETLGVEEEIGACLASFGRDIQIRINHIGYHNPYFVVFHGCVEGDTEQRVRLVQHVTQLNVLFVAMNKDPAHSTPQRIGFHKASDELAQ